ncbi:hypothetical protein [Desulfomonile tiedjei]|uniref:Uncharacterized protein n=1 Tax=Desulfomonile tiedjei (strain ATCC 49306 / DSM 6799 / DCB-1) TaxID=706587 RepID=I4C7U6_DESTA|nr:hypothetical protein [Desulfomonile tiedjei]AFM25637.1 hypothetical protein Desti_2968 [Desulfomonile tiedjei DSM 6799]
MKKKKTVSASLVVHDIQIGISNAELMQKYQLSERELKKVFDKLFDLGRISQQVLDERKSGGVETPILLTHAELHQDGNPDPEHPVTPEISDPVNASHSVEPAAHQSKPEEQENLDHETLQSIQHPGQRESFARRFMGLAKRVAVIAIVFSLVGAMSGSNAKNDGANVSSGSWLNDLYQSIRSHPFLESSPTMKTQDISEPEREEPLDYPVQRVRKDATAKEILETMIKLEVLLEDAKPSDYCTTTEYFLRSSSPNIRLALKNFLYEEYGCGIPIEDMETVRHIVNDVVKHRLALQKSSSLATATGESQDESLKPANLPSRSEKWLQGEAFLERLSLLNKDTPTCTNAVKGLFQFVNATIDEAVHERDRYEARSFKDAASQIER